MEIIEEEGYFCIRIGSDYNLQTIMDKFKEAAKNSKNFKELAGKPLENLLPIICIYVRTCGCHMDVYLNGESK